ncbi:hypothetical protein QYE76_019203 [Lolium multiflorum]|uniref:Transposon protein, putative, CACTA, En/Spm sub-class n=1 Tax=Lolium multiflorum TaxID=4521 RepID=A0AAD8VQ72_LOLMU|nr:hypothetical protein QYE76_019203 [Lolium multiflorum]
MKENEEDEDDDRYPMFPEYGDTATGGAEDEEAPDEPADDHGRAIADAKSSCETEKERLKFDKMLENHNKLLYPSCEDGHKKLRTTLEFLQWKAENGVTNRGFEKLLKMVKKLLPKDNKLPASTYESKKVVYPLGLDVQKIHVCSNDCILYRAEEYENLDACPVCNALRYKIRRDDPGEVEGEERPRKRVPANGDVEIVHDMLSEDTIDDIDRTVRDILGSLGLGMPGSVANATFSHLAQRIQRDAATADASIRSQIQNESAQLGVAMQHLGAMLLELGRTMMMLRMGASSANAFVNAGSAVYINPTGPNPIMVQPSYQSAPHFGVSSIPVLSGVSGPFSIVDPSRTSGGEVSSQAFLFTFFLEEENDI